MSWNFSPPPPLPCCCCFVHVCLLNMYTYKGQSEERGLAGTGIVFVCPIPENVPSSKWLRGGRFKSKLYSFTFVPLSVYFLPNWALSPPAEMCVLVGLLSSLQEAGGILSWRDKCLPLLSSVRERGMKDQTLYVMRLRKEISERRGRNFRISHMERKCAVVQVL